MDIVSLLIQIVAGIIIVAPTLWVSGRLLVGGEKARFTDAVWIVALGVIVGTVVDSLVGGLVASLITIVVWLALIKHFFDCGWLKALAIAIIAALIFVVVVIVLALIGIGVLSLTL